MHKQSVEANEGMEFFGFMFPHEMPEYRGNGNEEKPEELQCITIAITIILCKNRIKSK